MDCKESSKIGLNATKNSLDNCDRYAFTLEEVSVSDYHDYWTIVVGYHEICDVEGHKYRKMIIDDKTGIVLSSSLDSYLDW